MKTIVSMLWVSLALVGCSTSATPLTEPTAKAVPESVETDIATVAGGCFWCMEPPYEKRDGVLSVISGYAGGTEVDPAYKDVARGKTSHREVVQITYDPTKISYEEIVEIFWRQVDPTDDGGQFVDRGFQYTTAIFTHDESQQKIAEASKAALIASKRHDAPVITPIIPFTNFYPAEDYHQDYYKKNPLRYKTYRRGSGRDQYLDSVWEE